MSHRRHSTTGQKQSTHAPTDTIGQSTAPSSDDQETHVEEPSVATVESAAGQDTDPTTPAHDHLLGPLDDSRGAPPTNPINLAQDSLTGTLPAAGPAQAHPQSTTTEFDLNEQMIREIGPDSTDGTPAPSEYLDQLRNGTGMAWELREPSEDTESARTQAARFFAEAAEDSGPSARAQTSSQTSLSNESRLSNRLSNLRQLQVEEPLRPLRRPSLTRSRTNSAVTAAQTHVRAHPTAQQTLTDPNTEHVAEEASTTPGDQVLAAVRTMVDRRRQEAEENVLHSAPNNAIGNMSTQSINAGEREDALRNMRTSRPAYVPSTSPSPWAWDTDEVQVPQPNNVRRRTAVPGRDYPEQEPAVVRNEGLLVRDAADAMRHARYPALDAPRAVLQARIAERQALANADDETNPIEASGPGEDQVAAAQRALATTIDGRQREPPSLRNSERHNKLRKERIQDQLAKNECPICQEELTNPVSTTCGHVFCRACVEPWVRDHEDCPTCREAHVVGDLVSMNRRGMGA